jgi:fructose-1,6-bisphosphatase/inositol monophosphatase family enzyme
VIDPIDGTTNFIHGIPGWTVVLAGVVGKKTEVGAIASDVRVVARVSGTPHLRLGDRVPVRLGTPQAHIFAAGPHGARLNQPSVAHAAGPKLVIATPSGATYQGAVS